jgi:cytochrome c peroxidase
MATLRVRSILLVAACSGPALAADVDPWTERELRILGSLVLGAAGSPPLDPSNRFAADPAAVRLGQRLFFDKALSGNGEISCASCHVPDKHFTDGRARSAGVRETGRNTPTVVGSAYQGWFYWDGRRDSLWSQALIPFEAGAEMGGSRVAVVRRIGTEPAYRRAYESVFGAFPEGLLDPQLPAHAGPFGDGPVKAAWTGLTPAVQRRVNEVYANAGKAIAAYERTLRPRETRFDRYVAALLETGERKARTHLSAQEVAGLRLFIDEPRTRCLRCHNGPLLTNGGFHNVGTGTFAGERPDFGRAFGLRAVLLDEFNCLGPFSDAAPEDCLELRFLNRDAHVPLEGAFKTPSLRNVAATAPYGHDGRFRDLDQVLRHYNVPPPVTDVGPHELGPLGLSDRELGELRAFLAALSEIEDRPAGRSGDP